MSYLVDPKGDEARFVAFVSYRHVTPDREAAKWLHRSLETFTIPTSMSSYLGAAKRLGKVFRDEDELHATGDLPDEIKSALDRSDWLIVVCSSNTPESEWVCSEVRHFIENGRKERIRLLLIEGEPETSFPSPLLALDNEDEHFATVPILAADIRPKPDERPRDLRSAALLRLIAAILGCSFDDLRRREENRTRQRNTRIVTASLLGALLFGFIAVFADINAVEADQQRQLAIVGNADAKLALGDAALEDRRLIDAELAYVDALLLVDDRGTRERLIEVRSRGLEHIWEAYSENGGTFTAALSNGRLATVFEDNSLGLWSLTDMQLEARYLTHQSQVIDIAAAPSGLRLASLESNGTIVVTDFNTEDQILGQISVGPRPIRLFYLDDRSLMLVRQNSVIERYDSETLEMRDRQHVSGDVVTAAEIDQTGGRIFFGTSLGAVTVRQLSDMTEIARYDYEEIRVEALAFDRDSNQIAVWGSVSGGSGLPPETMVISVFDTHTGALKQTLPETFGFPQPRAMAFLNDGRVLAVGQIATAVNFWNLEENSRILEAPVGAVSDVTQDPQTGHVVSVGDRMSVFSSDIGSQIPMAIGHVRSAQSAAFLPDDRLVSVDLHGDLFLWNLSTSSDGLVSPIHHFDGGGNSSQTSIIVDESGNIAITCLRGIARVWNLETGNYQGIKTATKQSQCASFDPAQLGFWSVSRDGALQRFDFQALEMQRFGSPGSLDGSSIQSLADGTGVFASSTDNRVGQLNRLGVVQTWFAPAFARSVQAIAVTNEGDRMAAIGGGDLHMWSLTEPSAPIWSFSYDGDIHSIDISPDGHRVAISTFEEVIIFNAFDGERIEARFDPSPRQATHANWVKFAPDGRSLVVAMDGGSLAIWRFESSELAQTIRSPVRRSGDPSIVAAAAFAADGSRVAIVETGGTVSLWDVEKAQLLARQQIDPAIVGASGILTTKNGFVTGSRGGTLFYLGPDLMVADSEQLFPNSVSIAIHDVNLETNQVLFSYDDGEISTHMWTLATYVMGSGAEPEDLGTHDRHLLDAMFDPCGTGVISGSYDRTAKVWRGDGALPLNGHDGTVTSVIVSPDCSWIVTASRDSRVRVFDRSSGELVHDFLGYDSSIENPLGVEAIRFSTDGDVLYSAGWDGAVRAWDTKSWSESYSMHGFFDGWVQLRGHDPTGARLFSHTQDQYYRLWNLKAIDAMMSAEPSEIATESLNRFALSSIEDDTETVSRFLNWFYIRFNVMFRQ